MFLVMVLLLSNNSIVSAQLVVDEFYTTRYGLHEVDFALSLTWSCEADDIMAPYVRFDRPSTVTERITYATNRMLYRYTLDEKLGYVYVGRGRAGLKTWLRSNYEDSGVEGYNGYVEIFWEDTATGIKHIEQRYELPWGGALIWDFDFVRTSYFDVDEPLENHRWTPVINGGVNQVVSKVSDSQVATTRLEDCEQLMVTLGEHINIADNVVAKTGSSQEPIALSTTTSGPEVTDGKIENIDSSQWPMNNGSVFTGIGSSMVEQKVTDGDGDSTTFSRRVNVTTTGKPSVGIYYNGGTTPYGGEWLSTHASADTNRKRKLDIYTETAIRGDYNAVIYKDNVLDGTSKKPVTNKTTTTSEKVSHYTNYTSTNTLAAGTTFTSALMPLDVETPLLSGKSNASTAVKFDNNAPSVTGVEDTSAEKDWTSIKVNATDAGNSGLGKSYYKWVPSTDVAPTTSSTGWSDVTAFSAEGSGSWDLYVYATDNATNKSSVTKANTDGPIVLEDEDEDEADTRLVIIKFEDTLTSKRLEGAKFEIRRASDGEVVKTVSTSMAGITIAEVPADTYDVVEIEAPGGYQLNAAPKRQVVAAGTTTILEVPNTKTFLGE